MKRYSLLLNPTEMAEDATGDYCLYADAEIELESLRAKLATAHADAEGSQRMLGEAQQEVADLRYDGDRQRIIASDLLTERDKFLALVREAEPEIQNKLFAYKCNLGDDFGDDIARLTDWLARVAEVTG